MSSVSIFLFRRPEPIGGRLALQREPRSPAAKSALRCQHLCQQAGCPADCAAFGGVATGDEVVERLRNVVRQPVSLLARWIVDRQVIAFTCQAGVLLPLFQFDFAGGRMRSGVVPAISELAGVMNDDEIARWFAQPNNWLNGAVPAQTICTDAQAVLAAARTDRFVVNG